MGIYKRPESNYYWIRYSVNGRERRESTKATRWR